MTAKQIDTVNSLPNLVGTKFVKNFREFLLTLIGQNKELTEKNIQKTCLIQLDVKPTTTSRYLKEFVELDILSLDKNGFYHISKVD